MGRRGSRSTHRHAVRGGELRYFEGRLTGLSGPTWCGEDHGHSTLTGMPEGEDPHAFSRRMADCPKCSAAIGKVRLAQIANRVQIEAAPVPTTSWGKRYRSLYKVIIDGTHIAWIVMDNGWGNPWELRELTADGDRDFGGIVSSTPSWHSNVPADAVFQPVHTRSKEMLASAALRLRDTGKLLTLEEMEVKRAERRRQREEEDREREEARRLREIENTRKAGLRNERKELALDWLNAVLAQPDLTNSQRAGAQAAHDIITGKDVQ